MSQANDIYLSSLPVDASTARKIADLMINPAPLRKELIGLEGIIPHPMAFCAYQKSNPSNVLAPVLVKGLYQAAESSNPNNLYWLTKCYQLVLLHQNEVSFVATAGQTEACRLDAITPASPQVTDFLFVNPLNNVSIEWGGHEKHSLCQGGPNGHHLVVESSSGVAVITPNTYTLYHWYLPLCDGYERHVVEYNYVTNELIYWKQYSGINTSEHIRLEGSFSDAQDLFWCLPPDARGGFEINSLSFENVIQNQTNRAVYTNTFRLVREQVRKLKDAVDALGGVVDAKLYDDYQHVLYSTLEMLQKFPLSSSRDSAINRDLSFRVIPEAIKASVALIFNKSLDLPILIDQIESILNQLVVQHTHHETTCRRATLDSRCITV